MRTRQRASSPATATSSAAPSCSCKLERFEGFFLEPDLLLRHAPAPAARRSASTSSTTIAARLDRRHLHELPPRRQRRRRPGCSSTRAHRARHRGQRRRGRRRGAALLGVPILAAPVLSFPLSDERKSGWLPPSIGIDSRSGFQSAVPYYWNIAPNRDATFTPLRQHAARRRRSTPSSATSSRATRAQLDLKLLPRRPRRATARAAAARGARRRRCRQRHPLRAPSALRVSDDDYWKDFPRRSADADAAPAAARPAGRRGRFGDGLEPAYARVQRWQVLQDRRPGDAASSRPTSGAADRPRGIAAPLRGGFEVGFETEFNRFSRRRATAMPARAPTGSALHALGSISRPFRAPGWSLTPKLALNAATLRARPAARRRPHQRRRA